MHKPESEEIHYPTECSPEILLCETYETLLISSPHLHSFDKFILKILSEEKAFLQLLPYTTVEQFELEKAQYLDTLAREQISSLFCAFHTKIEKTMTNISVSVKVPFINNPHPDQSLRNRITRILDTKVFSQVLQNMFPQDEAPDHARKQETHYLQETALYEHLNKVALLCLNQSSDILKNIHKIADMEEMIHTANMLAQEYGFSFSPQLTEELTELSTICKRLHRELYEQDQKLMSTFYRIDRESQREKELFAFYSAFQAFHLHAKSYRENLTEYVAHTEERFLFQNEQPPYDPTPIRDIYKSLKNTIFTHHTTFESLTHLLFITYFQSNIQRLFEIHGHLRTLLDHSEYAVSIFERKAVQDFRKEDMLHVQNLQECHDNIYKELTELGEYIAEYSSLEESSRITCPNFLYTYDKIHLLDDYLEIFYEKFLRLHNTFQKLTEIKT